MQKAIDENKKPTVLAVSDPSFDIYSWCPTPQPTVPPTEVHLHMNLGPDAKVVVRFKGPRTLDLLIAALEDHRRDVFGAD